MSSILYTELMELQYSEWEVSSKSINNSFVILTNPPHFSLSSAALAMLLGSVIYRNSIYPLILLVLVLGVVVELLFFLGLEIVMRRNYSSVMIYTHTHACEDIE